MLKLSLVASAVLLSAALVPVSANAAPLVAKAGSANAGSLAVEQVTYFRYGYTGRRYYGYSRPYYVGRSYYYGRRYH
jgi:hypothetical protein